MDAFVEDFLTRLGQQAPSITAASGIRAQFTLNRLQRPSTTQRSAKTTRCVVLQEQLKRIEDQYKVDMSVIEDLQEFLRLKTKLQSEYSSNMNKLVVQFMAKRKWPEITYAEGHSQVLFSDLHRTFVNATLEESRAHLGSAESISAAISVAFETCKEEKKAAFRVASTIITNLQEELVKLDASVIQLKKEYDASMKDVSSYKKKSEKKQVKAELQKLETKASFNKNLYLLELAAANQHYLKYRNEQLPEVLDTLKRQDLDFLSTTLANISVFTGTVGTVLIDARERITTLAKLVAPELERRSFFHEYRHEFPGRQLFEMEPYNQDEPRDIILDYDTRSVLLQIRKLLEHSSKTIVEELSKKEEQMSSLQSLLVHYSKTSELFEKSQVQSITDKMEILQADIEACLLKKSHHDVKIGRITSTGIDEMPSPPPSPTAPAAVMDIEAAQLREENKRAKIIEKRPSDFSSDTPVESTKTVSRQSSGVSVLDSGNRGSIVISSPQPLSPSVADKRGSKLDMIQETSAPGSPASITSRKASLAPSIDLTSPSSSPASPIPSPMGTAFKLPPAKSVSPVPPSHQPPPVAPSIPPPVLSPPSSATKAPPTSAKTLIFAQAASGESTTDGGDPLPPPPPADDEDEEHEAIPSPPHDADESEDLPQRRFVLYDYAGEQEDDLPLREGDSILLLLERDDGWAQGINSAGRIGFYPSNYARPVQAGDQCTIAPARELRLTAAALPGFSLQEAKPVVISKVTPGSAAALAGFHTRDIILQIDNDRTHSWTTTQIWEKIRGNAGVEQRYFVLSL
eukprot:m.44767 g.44767  ORF g.44767 m.44767 type:complete len:800 (+) comp47071_c0_seq1:13-2412(+)